MSASIASRIAPRAAAPPPSTAPHRRRVSAVALAAESAGFDLMAKGKDRKYYMVGGKGGVGKTSLSSSLAVKFATAGHHTLLVSTDPAHSLSDSLAQDVTGGLPVAVEGTDGMMYAMEVDPDQAKAEFTAFAKQADISAGAKDFMSSVGLGGLADQLGDLGSGIARHPAPGLDEGIAIAKVRFIKDEKYAKFRMCSTPRPQGTPCGCSRCQTFWMHPRKDRAAAAKLTSAGDAVKSLFGVPTRPGTRPWPSSRGSRRSCRR